MSSPAVVAMIAHLREFLPPMGASFPPTVSLVSAQEKQVGLGQWRQLDVSSHFPVSKKGVQVAATTRFQLWDASPDAVEAAVAGLTHAVLDGREQLRTDGFLELKLKNVSIVDKPDTATWRQTADFDVVYEFHFTDSDMAGGLIARIPAELRTGYGAMLISGDLAVWHFQSAQALVSNGGRGAVTGLSSLESLPGAAPADPVTIRRTFEGAAGQPDAPASFADFLTAVLGPTPVSRHAAFTFPTFTDFQTELGDAGDPVEFADELGISKSYSSRSLTFVQPIELSSRFDRLELSLEGAAIGAGQVFYIRVRRGQKTSA